MNIAVYGKVFSAAKVEGYIGSQQRALIPTSGHLEVLSATKGNLLPLRSFRTARIAEIHNVRV